MTATPKKESWKEIRLGVKAVRTRYAVSDAGRVCSFREKPGDGRLLGGTLVNGYPALKLKVAGRDFQFYIHKLVATLFLEKRSRRQQFVIHLDHDKCNNNRRNLRWASKTEVELHQQQSPRVRSYRERLRQRGHKLTAANVRAIKRKLAVRKRSLRMKDIAAQFGISEMHLYRIKAGENWGHIR